MLDDGDGGLLTSVELVFMSVSIYYSNHICVVGWWCWLLYMMVPCWYRSPGTRMTHGADHLVHGQDDNNEHLWWCHATNKYQYCTCRVQWITYCPMGTIRMEIKPLHLPLLSWWEPYKRHYPRCRLPPSHHKAFSLSIFVVVVVRLHRRLLLIIMTSWQQ